MLFWFGVRLTVMKEFITGHVPGVGAWQQHLLSYVQPIRDLSLLSNLHDRNHPLLAKPDERPTKQCLMDHNMGWPHPQINNQQSQHTSESPTLQHLNDSTTTDLFPYSPPQQNLPLSGSCKLDPKSCATTPPNISHPNELKGGNCGYSRDQEHHNLNQPPLKEPPKWSSPPHDFWNQKHEPLTTA